MARSNGRKLEACSRRMFQKMSANAVKSTQMASCIKDVIYPLLRANEFRRNLQKDKIDLNQWKINTDYLESGVSLLPKIDPTPRENFLDQKATPLVKILKNELNFLKGVNLPPMLNDLNPWFIIAFISAYPDVVDFFYPISHRYDKNLRFILTEGSRDVTNDINESVEEIFNTMMEAYLKENPHLRTSEMSERDIEKALFFMKNYYGGELGKKFLLSKV